MINKTISEASITEYFPSSILKEDSDPSLSELLADPKLAGIESKLVFPLGEDMLGELVLMDLSLSEHCIVLGSSKKDKLNLLRSIIVSLLFRASANEIRFILIDSTGELQGFKDIPHLLTPVVSEPEKILSVLKWATDEIDRRKTVFHKRGVVDINSFNQMSGSQTFPHIVIFIDTTDMMSFAREEVEYELSNLLKGSPYGIHLIITPDNSRNDLFSSISSKIIFKTTKNEINRTGFNSEKLIDGDFLFMNPNTAMPICIQSVPISLGEVSRLRMFLINNQDKVYVMDHEEIEKAYQHYKKSDGYDNFLKTHELIINKFCEISARKVSIIDEYGEENWSILDSEKQKCFAKIVNKLGVSEKFIDNLFMELEQYELSGATINSLASYMGQNLRYVLFQLNSEFANYSSFLVRLYFLGLEEIFKKNYPTLKKKLGNKADYAGLSGIDFESILQQRLSENGFSVTGTPVTGDQGADIIASKNGKKFIIQAKQYSGLVGNKAVQEVVAAKNYYSGDVAVVITNSHYTPAAKDLAQKNKVILIDSDSLPNLTSYLNK